MQVANEVITMKSLPFVFMSSAWMQGNELARIDVVQQPRTMLPMAEMMSNEPTPHRSTHAQIPKPSLELNLSTAVEIANKNKGLFDIRIMNVSDQDVVVPTSKDGEWSFRTCAEQPILTSSLALVVDGRETVGAELYGCLAFTGSLTTLKPGDWITICGMPAAKAAQSDTPVILSYVLGETTYTKVGLKSKSSNKTLLFIRTAIDSRRIAS